MGMFWSSTIEFFRDFRLLCTVELSKQFTKSEEDGTSGSEEMDNVME